MLKILAKDRNNVIRETMNIMNSSLVYIRYKQFNWYDHMQRKDEENQTEKKRNGDQPGRRK